MGQILKPERPFTTAEDSYGVFFPYDGFLAYPFASQEEVQNEADSYSNSESALFSGVYAVRVRIERI